MPTRCPGCGGAFPDLAGPVHRYMESSPGCWAAFGRVLAREYTEAALGDVHRLSVDAYAAQHPGRSSRQAINSVGMHLVRLHLMLERGFDVREANRVMVALAKVKHRFYWLTPPGSMGALTVADVVDCEDAAAHRAAVRRWAAAVWTAWTPHHATVETWAASLAAPEG